MVFFYQGSEMIVNKTSVFKESTLYKTQQKLDKKHVDETSVFSLWFSDKSQMNPGAQSSIATGLILIWFHGGIRDSDL